MSIYRHRFLWLPVAAVMAGCTSLSPIADTPRDVAELGGETAAQFCYPGVPVTASLELVKEKRRYRLYNGEFDPGLPGDDDEPVTFELYLPAGVERPPVAIVMPILNGQKDIVRPFATYFVKGGYAAIIVDSRQRTTLDRDIVEPQAAIVRAVRRHRRMLDWVESRPDLDAGRIVVFGASLGGFNAFMLSAVDERVKAVVPALAGADLPYIFANSTERRIDEAFSKVMADLELDRADLEAYMRERIETDPEVLARFVDRDRVMMVVARKDTSVPVARQEELRALLGEPQTLYLPTGHNTAAAFIFSIRAKVRKFFDAALAGEPIPTVAVSPASCLKGRSPPIMEQADRRRDDALNTAAVRRQR